MDLFGRRGRIPLLIAGASIVFIILIGQFLKGGVARVQEGFIPVNNQMQELLDQTSGGSALSAATKEKTDANVIFRTPAGGAAVGQSKTDSAIVNQGLLEPATSPSASASVPGAPLAVIAGEGKNELDTHGKTELNTATLEQLDALPGIGPSKANAILAYRAQVGGFRHLDELLEVKGIGAKILEKLKPHLYVASP